ncbi:MAG: tRNA (adenosine(37)-N6)-threonylcarbamoyltransferase complex dimerization subunit type 1 TsaB, partial [Chloroflexi bacterium]|nr:tRNA (adenosine(37)-N6)-threonylcarbamoyltransferase complex dimerization subunit type 1 TsaB [Chloroflexota bacterium]
TASALASVALSRGGEVIAESTWHCQRNHTVELLPAIEQLLANASVSKSDLTAVFVSVGPGMYTGLRVGVATAQGLARASDLPLVGVGRLELDAYPHASFAGNVVAAHRAGRGDLAWATYQGDPWRELTPPRLTKGDELVEAVRERTLLVGEIDEELAALLAERAADLAEIAEPATAGRAVALAELGHARLETGAPHEPALIAPVYLRPPAIGPQKQ